MELIRATVMDCFVSVGMTVFIMLFAVNFSRIATAAISFWQGKR